MAAHAQMLKHAKAPDAMHGQGIYQSGCVACHGDHGNGAPQTSTEFKRPSTFPDFMNCSQTTAEPDSIWKAMIVLGGLGSQIARFGEGMNTSSMFAYIIFVIFMAMMLNFGLTRLERRFKFVREA